MTKLKEYLEEAREMIEQENNYAGAFGYLEVVIENYIKGGERNGRR